MIVLDTTVLIYAVGSDHPLRMSCREIVRGIDNGSVEATTTVEVIQEFAHVRARRRGRDDAAELARDYAEMLSPLLIAEESDLAEGLRLFESHPGLGSFDCVLAAAAHAAGCYALVSADSAFSDVKNIRHVVPDQDGVRELFQ